MIQHCQKVHGTTPLQKTVPSTAPPVNPSENDQSITSSSGPESQHRDLRDKLEAELEEARVERSRTLQAIEDKIESLRSERDSAIQRYDAKIKALENLIDVLDVENS